MIRCMNLALIMALLVGGGLALSACEGTQTGVTQSQFDKPFDGSTFKGRRD
jgi:hypothetical protein